MITMRLLILITFLISSILAHEFPPWSPPSGEDVRSPCPGLNTLANHGIIPHSGRGLSVGMLQKAFRETYNIALDISTTFSLGGLLASPHPFRGTFDLSDLKKHNYIEHDVSLSRADLAVSGDPVSFSEEVWKGVLEGYEGMTNTTIEAAARVRENRALKDQKENPRIKYGAKEKLLSYGETALYLSAMGGVKTGSVPVEWVNIWFSQERLPIAEGWTPSKNSINGINLNVLIGKLIRATTAHRAKGGKVAKEAAKKDEL